MEIGEATQAAATCFQAWLNERGGIGAGEDHAAIRQVRQFFEAHGTSRFTEIRAGVVHPSSPSWQQKLSLDPPEDHIDETRTLNRCGWRRYDKAEAGSFWSCRKRGNPRSVAGSMARWRQRHWRIVIC